MSVTGHRSIDAVRVYKKISCEQEEELSKMIQHKSSKQDMISPASVEYARDQESKPKKFKQEKGMDVECGQSNAVPIYNFSNCHVEFHNTVKNDLLKIRKNLLTPTSAKMLLFQDVFLLILVCPTTN